MLSPPPPLAIAAECMAAGGIVGICIGVCVVGISLGVGLGWCVWGRKGSLTLPPPTVMGISGFFGGKPAFGEQSSNDVPFDVVMRAAGVAAAVHNVEPAARAPTKGRKKVTRRAEQPEPPPPPPPERPPPPRAPPPSEYGAKPKPKMKARQSSDAITLRVSEPDDAPAMPSFILDEDSAPF